MGAFLRSSGYVAGTIAYVANKQAPALQVPLAGRFVRRLWLFITGTLHVTGGTGVGTIDPDNAAALIRDVTVKFNGEVKKQGYGPAFLRIGQRYDKTAGRNQGITSKAAGADNPFTIAIPIMFESPFSVQPMDTLLDGRFGNTLDVYVTFGDGTSLIHGNDGALAFTVGPTTTVLVEDTDVFPTVAGFWDFFEAEHKVSGVVTSKATRLPIPVTPAAKVRGILIYATDAGVPSDAILNAVTLRINGKEKPRDTLPADFLKVRADHEFEGQITAPTGYYHLELAEYGSEGALVQTTGLGGGVAPNDVKSIELILDTTVGVGATEVTAHVIEHVPPQAARQPAAF